MRRFGMRRNGGGLVFGAGALGACLALAAPGEAATRCVSPTVVSCHDTIQEAVDLSAAGDTVIVYEGTYAEEVTIATPNLTIRGRRPGTKKPITSFAEFKGLETELRKLGLHANQYLATCPKSIVQVCETPSAPTSCGSSQFGTANGITVDAPGVTIQDLTISHARVGILIPGVTDTTVRGVCLRANRRHSLRAEAGSHRTTVEDVSHSGENTSGVIIEGDDAAVRRSIGSHTYYGFDIHGDRFEIDRNATAFNSICISGGNAPTNSGRITRNAVVACESDMITSRGLDVEIAWNLAARAALGGVSIRVSDSRIHDNIATDMATQFEVRGDGNEVFGNLIRRLGGYRNDRQSLLLWGNLNQLRDNVFAASTQRGVEVRGDDNVIARNRFEGNGLAGLTLRSGMRNRVDRNVFADNRGEGLANLATDTAVTNNVSTRNRTGICNQGGTITTFTGNTVPDGSGPGTVCVVEE